MVELLFELLSSLVVFGIAVGIALAVTRLVTKLVQGYAKRTSTTLDDEILPVLNWPLGVAIVLSGVEASLLRLEVIQSIPLLAKSLELGFPIVWTLLAGLVAYRLVNILLTHLAHIRKETHPGLISALKPVGTLVRLLIMLTLLLTVLNLVGVDIAPYILGWGLLGFAIVLALQPILQDFVTGLYVSLAQPYKVGDVVQLPSGEICEIKDIKAQQAQLYNLVDRSFLRIPNTDLMKTKVVLPGEYGVPLIIPFKLTIDSDFDLAKSLAKEIASAIPEVSKEPEATAYLVQLNGTAAGFEIVCWLKDPSSKRKALDAINIELRRKFAEAGIRFPT